MTEQSENQKWFSARELADLRLSSLPHSKRNMNRKARVENWPCRPRKGNGGGVEYPLEALPEEARIALAMRSEAASSRVLKQVKNRNSEILWKIYSQASEKAKAEVTRRLDIVYRILRLQDAGMKKTQAVDLIAKETETSPATIYNWFRSIDGIDRQDWPPVFLPKHKGNETKAQCSPEALDFFKANYLGLNCRSAKRCFDDLESIAKGKGWVIPSEKTILRHLRRDVSREEIVLAREGEKALKQIYPAQERDKSCLRALECVDVDGHRFDVFCKWPDGTIARPIGLFFHDVYSGKLLSWRVDLTENKDLVRLAFADLVEIGIPNHIILDNSRAFASKWISGGARKRFRWTIRDEDPQGIFTLFGCVIHPTTPYSGQSKPIERAFRDLADRVSKHPSFVGAYCGKNPNAKPEDYGSRAVDIDVFLKVLAQEIQLHNARNGRRSPVCNGRSFDSVFLESYAKGPICKGTKEQRAFLLLAADGVMTDRKNGSIKLYGNRFWSEDAPRYAGQKVTVRFDPDNIRAGVFVYNLSDNSLLWTGECIWSGGFLDSEDAREHARKKRHFIKSTKEALKAQKRMTELEVAAMLPEGMALEIPSPKVIEGLFEEKLETKRKGKEAIDWEFTTAMDGMNDEAMREVRQKYA